MPLEMQLPDGFHLFCGSLRLRENDNDDCLLIVCDDMSMLSGVFARNVFCGAPILWNKQQLDKSNGFVRAILINTVFANAGTGNVGLDNARQIAEFVAHQLQIPPDQVLLASTGKIGPQLPLNKFFAGLPRIIAQKQGDIPRAAKAILTTDLAPKTEFRVLKNGVKLLGIAKGSGMIAPDMATMLAFVMTDAKLEKSLLDTEWKHICDETFHQISVDNCQSTSDMALTICSNKKGVDQQEFFIALKEIAAGLAKKIAADGEGASHLIEVSVRNADSQQNARAFAKAVVTSDLFKAAVAGRDPNWGRILSAIGSLGIPFDPAKVDVFLDSEAVFLQGEPVANPDKTRMFTQEQVNVEIDFHFGDSSAKAWGCDLTKRYVEINAEYST